MVLSEATALPAAIGLLLGVMVIPIAGDRWLAATPQA
jgi:hypothetical protein